MPPLRTPPSGPMGTPSRADALGEHRPRVLESADRLAEPAGRRVRVGSGPSGSLALLPSRNKRHPPEALHPHPLLPPERAHALPPASVPGWTLERAPTGEWVQTPGLSAYEHQFPRHWRAGEQRADVQRVEKHTQPSASRPARPAPSAPPRRNPLASFKASELLRGAGLAASAGTTVSLATLAIENLPAKAFLLTIGLCAAFAGLVLGLFSVSKRYQEKTAALARADVELDWLPARGERPTLDV